MTLARHKIARDKIACLAAACLLLLSANCAAAAVPVASLPVPAADAKLRVFRIYSDSAGVSHIARIDWAPVSHDAFGQHAVMQQYFASPATKAIVVGGAAGFHSPPHNTGGAREIVFILAGSSSTRTSDGATQDFHAGDIVLLEDVSGPGASVGFGPQGYLGLAIVLAPGH
jgi:hypothetical protein